MRRFATLLLVVTAGRLAAAERPNFLFVYTDDVRWDALGVVQREQGERARFPWLKTPNMDRLAAEGTRFRNAFVVNSLCSPSRATFLTGLYGHANGIVNNHTPFPSQTTWATLLKSVGYTTGYVGKFHMGPMSGQRPGFDFSASFVGQGRYTDCPVEVNGKSTPSTGWIDDVSTDYALKFLRETAGKPFSLAVGYKSAHGPFAPPPRHADTYANEQARPVPNLTAKAIYREDAASRAGTNLGYFRCVTAIDDNLGRLLAALDELKLADNTIVIYTSDNGFYLGEHGLGDKRSAYDESLRIPLIVRGPNVRRGAIADGMALNVDLAPTLCDYAGVAMPKTHGRSWRPLLEGTSANWRSAWFYCYFYENNFAIPTVTAVRTDTAKLVKYPGRDEWTEVFDLKADPYELKNLANDPAAAEVRKSLEAEYDRQAKAIDFRIPDFADKPLGDRPRDGLQAWILDYRFDADNGDTVIDASASKNHGTAKGTPLVDGKNGGKARRFDGKGHIDVPKSKSLDPSVLGWTVEATLAAEKPEGVIVARGGRNFGYCLFLERGKPAFAVTSRQKTTTVRSPDTLPNGWSTVTGQVHADKRLTLAVDGKEVASVPLHEFIRQDPNDGMQVGADLGSSVVEPRVPNFTGRIARLRVFSGQSP
ncbi:MAG: sulfatase-like hydrolase/transferase [Gemmataceae bacterium]